MSRDKHSRPFRFERIEPRILLSADALGGAFDADSFSDSELNRDAQERLDSLLNTLPRPATGDASDPLDLDSLGALDDKDEPRHELIIIDVHIINQPIHTFSFVLSSS